MRPIIMWCSRSEFSWGQWLLLLWVVGSSSAFLTMTPSPPRNTNQYRAIHRTVSPLGVSSSTSQSSQSQSSSSMMNASSSVFVNDGPWAWMVNGLDVMGMVEGRSIYYGLFSRSPESSSGSSSSSPPRSPEAEALAVSDHDNKKNHNKKKNVNGEGAAVYDAPTDVLFPATSSSSSSSSSSTAAAVAATKTTTTTLTNIGGQERARRKEAASVLSVVSWLYVIGSGTMGGGIGHGLRLLSFVPLSLTRGYQRSAQLGLCNIAQAGLWEQQQEEEENDTEVENHGRPRPTLLTRVPDPQIAALLLQRVNDMNVETMVQVSSVVLVFALLPCYISTKVSILAALGGLLYYSYDAQQPMLIMAPTQPPQPHVQPQAQAMSQKGVQQEESQEASPAVAVSASVSIAAEQ